MNTANLKTYAPKARNDFIEAVTRQAAKYGFTATRTEALTIKGDIALIGDRAFPKAIETPRLSLQNKIVQHGFHVVMEQAAYSWFNRLCAIRYMELHDYLGHGRRVLSHPGHDDGFQLLDECLDVDLPGLNQSKVRELKLDGTQDEALYRELLLAQCHALHEAMPFLFEPLDDETELLLPENLTKTDSLIKELVTAIPEEDWADIEIVGWLYQFYISEKKDQVIGKVVKSEDIPAATQLFTPNWIVKYMVQNSLGAQWLATYPESPLKEQMEYYIEPAEQTDEVNAQLAAITPSQLNPEKLTLIDPASGSGHILVEAYELFKVIYLERGYRQRDVPQLILEKNLFGLDIDERAAQLTGFALMMKGRGDDRRLFERGVKLNVMALQGSDGFEPEKLIEEMNLTHYGLQPGDLTELKRLFEHATTFGSLIQVPEDLTENLLALKKLSEAVSRDLFASDALKQLGLLVRQAELLAEQYDAVVANPPYMGNKYQTPVLKKYLKDRYPGYEKDFFSAFIDRELAFSKPSGGLGVVAPYVWMFISSFKRLRERLIDEASLTSLIQLEYNAFEPAMIPVATFTLKRRHVPNIAGSFINLSEFKGHENQAPRTLEAIENPDCEWLYRAQPDEFKVIPGSPVAYWVSPNIRHTFKIGKPLGTLMEIAIGLFTCDNDRFLRRWQEVRSSMTEYHCRNDPKTWVPYNKGGEFRKWYGNNEWVVNYANNGEEIRKHRANVGQSYSLPGESNYFKEGATWTFLSSSNFAARYSRPGFVFDVNGSSLFCEKPKEIVAFLCSNLCFQYLKILNPTLAFQAGNLKTLPIIDEIFKLENSRVGVIGDRACAVTQSDWDAYERSWDFQSFPLLTASAEPTATLESSYTAWITRNRDTIAEMKRLEEENNRLFIDAYGLADELTPDVPIEQITLTVNPAYRYGGKLTIDAQWTRFRQDTMEELVSYAIGCMMGRYSLDAPGLIYAHSGNEGFEPSRYPTFPADGDGIVPLTDSEWFDDDAANRLIEFLSVAWDKTHLEANLNFLADNLSPKRNETSRETLRRYLCDKFFKGHMQTYKKRPIYWLFSSGKEKAFQCLVYLHRYNEGTLARMRTEYVIPLTSKLASHVKKLEHDVEGSSSTSEAKGLEKEISRLRKQQMELSTFDEKLRHYADQQIKLDLDDGVKVNYGKFGDLLAEVKAITGKVAK